MFTLIVLVAEVEGSRGVRIGIDCRDVRGQLFSRFNALTWCIVRAMKTLEEYLGLYDVTSQ